MNANVALVRSHNSVQELLADLFRGKVVSLFHSSAVLLV